MEDRFWAKVIRKDDSECWEWLGAKNNRGYGQLRVNHKSVLAHRLSVLISTGEPPPESLLVCHHCDNPGCVNPKHLFVGTYSDNVVDMYNKGRNKTPEPPTHCPRGHERSPSNMYVMSNGTMKCKACSSITSARYLEENKEKIRQRKRLFYAANSERLREERRRYYYEKKLPNQVEACTPA
jgi:hypothetical protein